MLLELSGPVQACCNSAYKVHSLTQVGYKDDGDQVDESDCETENDEIDDPDGDEIGDEIDKDEMVDPDGNGESDEEKQTGPIKLSDFVIIKGTPSTLYIISLPNFLDPPL